MSFAGNYQIAESRKAGGIDDCLLLESPKSPSALVCDRCVYSLRWPLVVNPK